jgi:hypothetical protein
VVISFENNLKWTLPGNCSTAFREFQEALCIAVVSLHYRGQRQACAVSVRLLPQTTWWLEDAEIDISSSYGGEYEDGCRQDYCAV